MLLRGSFGGEERESNFSFGHVGFKMLVGHEMPWYRLLIITSECVLLYHAADGKKTIVAK